MNGNEIEARSYYMVKYGPAWPGDRRPSPLYLGVILEGAKENNLPNDYLDKLRKTEHNQNYGNCAMSHLYEEIERI